MVGEGAAVGETGVSDTTGTSVVVGVWYSIYKKYPPAIAKISRIPAITNGSLLFPSCSGLKSEPAAGAGDMGAGDTGEAGADGVQDGVVATGAAAGVPQLADPATGDGAAEEEKVF